MNNQQRAMESWKNVSRDGTRPLDEEVFIGPDLDDGADVAAKLQLLSSAPELADTPLELGGIESAEELSVAEEHQSGLERQTNTEEQRELMAHVTGVSHDFLLRMSEEYVLTGGESSGEAVRGVKTLEEHMCGDKDGSQTRTFGIRDDSSGELVCDSGEGPQESVDGHQVMSKELLCDDGNESDTLTRFRRTPAAIAAGDDEDTMRESKRAEVTDGVVSEPLSGSKRFCADDSSCVILPRVCGRMEIPGGIRVENGIVTVSKRYLYMLSLRSNAASGLAFATVVCDHLSKDGLRAEVNRRTRDYLSSLKSHIYRTLCYQSDNKRLKYLERYDKSYVQFGYVLKKVPSGPASSCPSDQSALGLYGEDCGEYEWPDNGMEFIGPDDGKGAGWCASGEGTDDQSAHTGRVMGDAAEWPRDSSVTEQTAANIQSADMLPAGLVIGERPFAEPPEGPVHTNQHLVVRAARGTETGEGTLSGEQTVAVGEHVPTTSQPQLDLGISQGDVVCGPVCPDQNIPAGICINNGVVIVCKGYLYSLAVLTNARTGKRFLAMFRKHLSRNGLRAELDSRVEKYLYAVMQRIFFEFRHGDCPGSFVDSLYDKYCRFSCAWRRKNDSSDEGTQDEGPQLGQVPRMTGADGQVPLSVPVVTNVVGSARSEYDDVPLGVRRSQRDRIPRQPFATQHRPVKHRKKKPRKIRPYKPVAGELQTSNQLVFAKGDGVVTYLQKCPGRPQACHSPETGAGAVAAVQAHPHTAAASPSAASSSAGAVTGIVAPTTLDGRDWLSAEFFRRKFYRRGCTTSRLRRDQLTRTKTEPPDDCTVEEPSAADEAFYRAVKVEPDDPDDTQEQPKQTDESRTNGENRELLTCLFCGDFVSTLRSRLTLHIKCRHPEAIRSAQYTVSDGEASSAEDAELLRCDVCNALFDLESSLIVHSWSHLDSLKSPTRKGTEQLERERRLR